MYENFIKNNIGYLNQSITKSFLEKKGIYLSDSESLIVTNLFKERWKELYNKDYENTFNLLKNKVSGENYQKLLNLYLSTIKEYL